MKVTIKTTEPQSMEIDWSKPMIVKNNHNGEIYVRTTGKHKGLYFEGINIVTGECLNNRFKRNFTPCTLPVTITFENEL